MSNSTEIPDAPVSSEIMLVIGPPFVGCVLSWALWGILVVQTYFYYLSFRRDRLALKATVYGLFIVDTFQNGICFDAAWFFLCNGWGRPSALQEFSFGFRTIPPTCGLVSLWVQAFYMYRIYILGKKKRLYIVIICVTFLVSVTQAIASLYVGIKLFDYHSLDQWHLLEVPIGIWNVGSTIADVLIAGCMVFLFSRFKNDTINRGHDATGDILNRLIRRSIESGAMTALTVILDTAVIYGQPNTTLFFVFSMMQTKVYTNSLMLSLNSRSKLFHHPLGDQESTGSSGLPRTHNVPHNLNPRLVHISTYTETFGEQRGADEGNTGPDIALTDVPKRRRSPSPDEFTNDDQ